MKIEKIKPIPKYILKMIEKKDKADYPKQDGCLRFYSYLTKNDGEPVKVTVAVKCRYKKWYAKQVAIHGVHSKDCFVKDMVFYWIYHIYNVGWYDMGFYKQEKWFEDGKWWKNDDKLFDPFAPIINKDFLSKCPEYQYAAWELYPYVDILKYLRLYEQYPQTEYLMKLGLVDYVFSKQILRKVVSDKRFRKWLGKNREELAKKKYYVSTLLNAYSKKQSIEETHAYEQAKKYLAADKDFKPIRDMLNGDYRRYIKYIAEQKTSNRSYLDYLKACTYLGIDMSEDKNRYPHDFKHWHDVRADEYKTAKALKDAEERAEMYARFAAVADKYLPMQYDKRGCFIAVIAKSPADLISEGDALHHCVGGMGYDQKFIREETLIFFIRSKNAPDIPLVTVEYSLKRKRVLQCYGDNDTKPADEILHYVNKVWLPYANRTLKQIAA